MATLKHINSKNADYGAAEQYLLFEHDEFTMKPIRQITQAAQVIGSGELSRRITGVETEDEVGELSETFNEMLDRLEDSFRRERQFTSDASHELRTPLAVVSACAEDALGSNASDSRESLMTIREEAERMTKIIPQLLMLSRGYEGRIHLEPEQIALREMLGSVCDELKDSASEKQIRLHNGAADGMLILADQSLMTKLLVNLIGNAIKYGRRGGNVWLDAEARDDGTHITVADDGIGISDEDLPQIFERFYRADSARDRSGFGLGLSIAEWIVELHRGKINVKGSRQKTEPESLPTDRYFVYTPRTRSEPAPDLSRMLCIWTSSISTSVTFVSALRVSPEKPAGTAVSSRLLRTGSMKQKTCKPSRQSPPPDKRCLSCAARPSPMSCGRCCAKSGSPASGAQSTSNSAVRRPKGLCQGAQGLTA